MNSLRIGWAAPWDADSMTARSAAQVAFALNRHGHSVTVLRTEVGQALDRPPRLAPGPIHALASVPAFELRQGFDVLVAHIGNNLDLHGAVPTRLADADFVGVFHDPGAADLMREWAKPDAAAIVDRAGEPDQERARGGLEWLAARMVASVAHTEQCARQLRDACPGPTAILSPAFMIPDLPPPPSAWSHMIVAVIGWVTASDRIDQLILAIAASPILRQRCRIKIIGDAPEEEQARVEALAQRLHVAPPTFIAGVADDELGWHMRDVDVVACLNPAFSPCSALLALAQISGRPILAVDQGCHDEDAAGNMLLCSEGHVARDAVRHLERWLDNPCRYTGVTERRGTSVACRHSADAYARSLLPLLENVVSRRPARAARRSLVDTLAGFGLPRDDPAAMRVEAVLAGLVTGGGSVLDN